jgi:hypothetical protein
MAFVSTSVVKRCETDDACQFERTAGGHLGVGCGYGRFSCNHGQQRRADSNAAASKITYSAKFTLTFFILVL